MVKSRLILTVAFLNIFFINMLGAQTSYKDTIYVQMPNGVAIEYVMDYQRIKVYKPYHIKLADLKDIGKELNRFVKQWNVLGIEHLENKKPLLIIDFKNEINISKRNNSLSVFFPKGTQLALRKNGKHKLEMRLPYVKVFIYFNDIEQIKDLATYHWEAISQNEDKALEPVFSDEKHRKNMMKAWLSVDKGDNVKLIYHQFSDVKNVFRHHFIISVAFNLQNINGRWATGCAINSDVIFGKRLGFRAGLESEYIFTPNGDSNRSTWLDLGVWAYDDKEALAGISFGFLLYKQEAFLNKNKFRISFSKRIFNNTFITPELYFNKFFKKQRVEDTYFALKISYGF